MRCAWRACVVLGATWLAVSMPLPAAAAPAAAGQARTAVDDPLDGGRFECDETYFRYLPGMVDYCLGIRDWSRGSYRSGLHLLKLAAGWGSKEAQYALGMIFFRGDQVNRDRVRGIAWLRLAAERHDPETERVVRSMMALANDAERQRAECMYRQMLEKYADRVAATRAWKRFKRWKAYQRHGEMSIVPACVIHGGANMDTLGATCSAADSRYKSRLESLRDTYFKGWRGIVEVGPLEEVEPAPAGTID